MRDGERLFDFHNESAWPACELFRNLISRWITDFDLPHQANLVSQMKATDSQFRHTLLELTTSALLRALKFYVYPHPVLSGTENRPDYLIVDDSSKSFIEVTTINPPDESFRVANREAALLKAINELRLPPGLVLSYRPLHIGKASIPVKSFAREVLNWAEQENLDSRDEACRRFVMADWEVEIGTVKTGSDRVYDSAIGVRFGGAHWVEAAVNLRSALDGKRSRYGNLSGSFILVVGDLKGMVWGRSRITEEIVSALYGSEVVKFCSDGTFRSGRASDGFWLGPKGPRNQHVSGVLFFPDAGLFGLRNELHLPQLAINPWATYPIPPALNILPRVELEGDNLKFKVGAIIADLIGLPSDWPQKGNP
jgi:hypothetical protein